VYGDLVIWWQSGTFSTVLVYCVKKNLATPIDTKMGWATSWAILFLTHPVTLVPFVVVSVIAAKSATSNKNRISAG
jgi:hypothetical protein